MKLICLFLLILLNPFPSSSKTVMYTSYHHPPDKTDPSLEIIWLDKAEKQLNNWFKSQGVMINPKNVEQIAKLLTSKEWKEQEQIITNAYREIIHAWQLGVERYPAVVVDERYVVYGLTDVDKALAEINIYRHKHGVDVR